MIGMKSLQVIYNETHYLEDIATSVSITGDIMQAARKCDVDIYNATDDRNEKLLDVELGKSIRIIYDGTELFRGVIFTIEDDESGNTKLSAYDEAIYLANNSDTRKLTDQTAREFILKM